MLKKMQKDSQELDLLSFAKQANTQLLIPLGIPGGYYNYKISSCKKSNVQTI